MRRNHDCPGSRIVRRALSVARSRLNEGESIRRRRGAGLYSFELVYTLRAEPFVLTDNLLNRSVGVFDVFSSSSGQSGTPYAKPPLARTTWLFIQPPSGPARNDTTPETSSDRPSRSRGGSFLHALIWASVFPFRNNSVATGPGAIAFTLMFRPRSSLV